MTGTPLVDGRTGQLPGHVVDRGRADPVLTPGAPVANRRALSPQELAVGPCSGCGGVIVPMIYGYPGMELFALADIGQAVLGGCVLPEDGPVASYACARCGTPVRLSPTASGTR